MEAFSSLVTTVIGLDAEVSVAFSDETCEMKRLYIAPAGRGNGAGRAIAGALVAHARELGYAEMLLDTLPSMIEAQAIYQRLGFVLTDPYRFNPLPGASFWRLGLR